MHFISRSLILLSVIGVASKPLRLCMRSIQLTEEKMSTKRYMNHLFIHVSQKKNIQIFFCHNFVKFLQTLIIFGTLMAKMTKLCKAKIAPDLFSTGASTLTLLSSLRRSSRTPSRLEKRMLNKSPVPTPHFTRCIRRLVLGTDTFAFLFLNIDDVSTGSALAIRLTTLFVLVANTFKYYY